MHVSIEHRPANTIARCTLDVGESFTCEGGSMIAMSQDLRIDTTTHTAQKSKALQAVKRLFAQESFFVNVYTAPRAQGELLISPALNGDILYQPVEGRTLMIKGGAYLGHHGEVSLDLQWGGLSGWIGAQSPFWLKATGGPQGHVLCNAFGAVYPIEVVEKYIVDTDHVVAFENTLNYQLTKVGRSWLGSFLGGEGLVMEFSGKGIVWCQSHSFRSFGTLLQPFLKAHTSD